MRFGIGARARLAAAASAILLLAASWVSGQTGTPCDLKAAPVALFSANCSDLACTFHLATALPPAGSLLEWSYGDGAYAEGPATNVAHTYAAGGFYLVTLTVSHPDGQCRPPGRSSTNNIPTTATAT